MADSLANCRGNVVVKFILLVAPCVLALSVPLFNRDEPRLFGFPFLYWSLFALVPLSALAIYGAFRIDRARGRA